MPLGSEDFTFTNDGEYSDEIPITADDNNIETKNFADPKYRQSSSSTKIPWPKQWVTGYRNVVDIIMEFVTLHWTIETGITILCLT
jgi:hypothetical protein